MNVRLVPPLAPCASQRRDKAVCKPFTQRDEVDQTLRGPRCTGGRNVDVTVAKQPIAKQLIAKQPIFRWNGVRRRLERTVATQVHVWCFLAAVAVCGLLFGGVVAGQLGDADASVLSSAVGRLLDAIAQHQLASSSDLWWQRMTSDAQLLALLWLLGLSVIGFPFVVAAVFLRAFSVGFAVGFTTLQFGWKGILVAGVAIFLHQVISLTVFILAGSTAIRFSADIVRQRYQPAQLSFQFLRYTGAFALLSTGLMVGAWVQANLAPGVLTWVLAGS
ncbi:MAG: stage II sporulation protein M [Alicyclobacillus sp.]|nr:stage II sporulation protein M [Alicyclobacillus sp.]